MPWRRRKDGYPYRKGMKAWVLTGHGPPEKVLSFRDMPDPVAGPGEVLVESEGFGLNYADTMAVRGLYREAPAPPCVIGYEVIGRVVALGSGTPAGLLGKRVVGLTRFGGFGQLAATDHRTVAVVPDGAPLAQALAMATQGITAWYMARVATQLWPGEKVLVRSAAGGVGQLLCQLAVASGCEVLAVASGQGKMEYLRSIGVQHTINRSGGNELAQITKALAGTRLDVSFNPVGGDTFKRDLGLLGSGGRVFIFGGAQRGAGAWGALRFVWRMGLLVPILLMMKGQSVLGVNMLRIATRRPDLAGHCLQQAVAAWQKGQLIPHSEPLLAADQLPHAISKLASGRTIGKLALRWDQ